MPQPSALKRCLCATQAVRIMLAVAGLLSSFIISISTIVRLYTTCSVPEVHLASVVWTIFAPRCAARKGSHPLLHLCSRTCSSWPGSCGSTASAADPNDPIKPLPARRQPYMRWIDRRRQRLPGPPVGLSASPPLGPLVLGLHKGVPSTRRTRFFHRGHQFYVLRLPFYPVTLRLAFAAIVVVTLRRRTSPLT